MGAFWHDLAANLAVVAAFLLAWAIAQPWLLRHRRVFSTIAMGLFMGTAAIASMLLAVEVRPGVIFDLRSAPLVIAGMFGGPVAGLLAGGLTAGYRLLLGGEGMMPGLSAITMVMLVGIVAHLLLRGRRPEPVHVLVAALAAALIPYLNALSLPGASLNHLGAATAAAIFGVTMAAGALVCRAQKVATDGNLWRMALMQAPDFHYVKDQDGRFAVVNEAMARYNGYVRPDDLVGRTDFDLTGNDRASDLFRIEQQIIRTGAPQLDHQERLIDRDGNERWFSTSKVPIYDADGQAIGIAGSTRDITEQRRMEAALTDSRNLLSYAVEGMSDGLAMFDRTGHLVYCNDRYRSMFPLTADVRQPGAHIRDILRHVVATGEQANLGDPEVWLQQVIGSFRKGGEQQAAMFDGRWLHIRTRPTEHGAAMVVVSDVTELKRTEGELLTLTSRLRVLAETDGLTGLINRRSFDARIEEEIARSEREARPVSLVLFDVDHFKAYNDSLGHPAGDECLRLIANSVSLSLLRQGDIVARYGGEEFVAILPDTDEDSAFLVAERVRTALAELGLPHAASLTGHVTLSAGIATYPADATGRSAAELLARADEALYAAKGAGRNRSNGWRQRHEVRAAG